MNWIEFTNREGEEIRRKAGDGPWSNEPDKIVWVDDATQLDCMIHRNRLGALCGYVGLPPGHLFHGMGYDNVALNVHGGLTYSNTCDPEADPDHGICHVPAEGREENIWWLGFDCAHVGDLTLIDLVYFRDETIPGYPDPERLKLNSYKTVGYVKAEIEHMAKQVYKVQ